MDFALEALDIQVDHAGDDSFAGRIVGQAPFNDGDYLLVRKELSDFRLAKDSNVHFL